MKKMTPKEINSLENSRALMEMNRKVNQKYGTDQMTEKTNKETKSKKPNLIIEHSNLRFNVTENRKIIASFADINDANEYVDMRTDKRLKKKKKKEVKINNLIMSFVELYKIHKLERDYAVVPSTDEYREYEENGISFSALSKWSGYQFHKVREELDDFLSYVEEELRKK